MRKKIYASGYVEFSKKYRGLPKEEIQKMWFGLTDEERYEFHSKAVKACPAAVDEVLLYFLLNDFILILQMHPIDICYDMFVLLIYCSISFF